MISMDNLHIGVIGLGYVGLPLAVEFAKITATVGFDIHQPRIDELESGQDSSLEVTPDDLKAATALSYTATLDDLKACNFYIVTVPTPIDDFKRPDLTPLEKASESLGKIVKKDDIIVFESTVYPGATEEVCIPIIEKISGLTFNKDFFAGYSPERINPGDKENTLIKIKKVTSGSTPEIADFVDEVYSRIIIAGTHKASSIKVAEAAKVIENTQRDVNIALINELALIFEKLDIDTEEVLIAAGTKWNFLPFRPGLVGGHCIGVDPYYLTHKAQEIGYLPEMILAGRRLNDGMGAHVSNKVIKMMLQSKIQVVESKILILGFTFKENCPDVRNTRIIDIVEELSVYNANVDIYDPWASNDEVEHEYGVSLVPELKNNHYDAVILAVSHSQFKEMGVEKIRQLGKENSILFDVKYLFDRNDVDGRL